MLGQHVTSLLDCLSNEHKPIARQDSSTASDSTLDILRAMGVKLAIDDYGTRYSSLSYLRRIRSSTLKIDRSFVSAWSESHEENLLRTMVHLGHDMDMNVVAEGIETVEELNFLKDINCNCYQGYLSAKPMFKDDVALTSWFRSGNR